MQKYTNREIDKILIEILINISQEKNIGLYSKFEDLGIDSLDAVEMIMELETKFDIEIDDLTAENMINTIIYLEDIKKVLKEKYGIFDIAKERKLKIDQIKKL